MYNFQVKTPIMVITAPNASHYIGIFNEVRTVYYCVDDFAEWPGLEKSLIQKMEEELIRKADVFVATSQDLFDKLAKFGKPTYLLTHGVDYELFQKESRTEHRLLEGIPKPRVGYFGLVDERSDQQLLISLAKRMPDISFIITGNIATDISTFKRFGNIYFTGSIPYHELPAMAKGWDVCMLPYKINRLTDAIQPLKIKEYLSTGKPVVSTPIKEARKLKEFVAIADNVDSWETHIRALINDKNFNNLDKQSNFLQKESWAKKAEIFFKICTEGI